MGKEIGHIEMTSKDLMQTKKFYTRLFGWKFELFGDKATGEQSATRTATSSASGAKSNRAY